MLLFLFFSHRVYSVIAPGDTIHVIGEFDGHGKCDVNRDQNYIIVHPEVLVSGTRVLFLFEYFSGYVYVSQLAAKGII